MFLGEESHSSLNFRPSTMKELIQPDRAQALTPFRQLPEPNRRCGGDGVVHVLSPHSADPPACHWDSL